MGGSFTVSVAASRSFWTGVSALGRGSCRAAAAPGKARCGVTGRWPPGARLRGRTRASGPRFPGAT